MRDRPYFRIRKIRKLDHGIEYHVYQVTWTYVRILWIIPFPKKLWVCQGVWKSYEEAVAQVVSMGDNEVCLESYDFRKDGTEITYGASL